jgi:hypothetical protein
VDRQQDCKIIQKDGVNMKKLVFGGICFLGGLLLLLIDPSFDAGVIDFILRVLIIFFTFFGLGFSFIGYLKKEEK